LVEARSVDVDAVHEIVPPEEVSDADDPEVTGCGLPLAVVAV
jgi:hypothetical protein